MDDWVIWLIIAAALGVGEVLSLSFFLAPFALGALAAAVVSAVGLGTALSLVIALIVSVLALTMLRPIARNHLRTPSRLKTGTAALVGQQAVVVEPVGLDAGIVKLEGETWTARSFNGETLAVGQRVHVMEIKGATAVVSE